MSFIQKDTKMNKIARNIKGIIYGITKEKRKFVVQVKQIKRTGKLYLMSVYPI